ncbi:MAG: hypothetical protein ACLGXA_09815 [Acidobacteriota bacterium]
MSSAREENPRRPDVDRFVLEEIESVPHIEALLILWNARPRVCSLEDLSALLYLPEDRTRRILDDLQQRSLVVSSEKGHAYNSAPARDSLLDHVDRTWRRELVRLSNLIHSKASPAVREFARAFRFKKENP